MRDSCIRLVFIILQNKSILASALHKDLQTYQFQPLRIVPCPNLAWSQRPCSRKLGIRLPRTVAQGGGLVFCAPLEVKGAQHGNIDAETGEHELDGTEHEGCERCACEVAEEVWKNGVSQLGILPSSLSGSPYIRFRL